VLNVAELKAAMARKSFTQKKLANALGISERTLGNRLKRKWFGTDEIEIMIDVLDIADPMPVFFDNQVTCEATRKRGE
jgi:transcriptional regulator with XRE-family HTH domain